MRPALFAYLALALASSACDNGRIAQQQAEIERREREIAQQRGVIETQWREIQRLSTLSQQQSEQIARFTEADRIEKEKKPSIVGAAYISRQSGDSTVLRDLQVSVFNSDIESVWRETVKDESKYEVQSVSPIAHLALDMAVIAFRLELVNRHLSPIATVNTDADGKFRFEHLPEGRYTIFANLRTAISAVVWLVPVDIRPGQTSNVSVTNSTARLVVNSSP
jgi:hypothetical protein